MRERIQELPLAGLSPDWRDPGRTVGSDLAQRRRAEPEASGSGLLRAALGLRRIAALVALASLVVFSVHAQATQNKAPTPSTNVDTQQLTLWPKNPVPLVTQFTATPSLPGPNVLAYWVVSHDANGNTSAPSGPFTILNQGNPSAGYPIALAYVIPSGVISVDILRTAGTNVPTGSCGCGVAVGIASGVFSDTVTSTTAYTVSTSANQINSILTNTSIGNTPGVSLASFAATGTGKYATNCTTASSGGVVTCPAIGFTPADVGKYIIINGPGGQATQSTIASYQSATQITAAANPWGASSGTATVKVAPDNTAALNAAVAAATAQCTYLFIPGGYWLFGVGATAPLINPGATGQSCFGGIHGAGGAGGGGPTPTVTTNIWISPTMTEVNTACTGNFFAGYQSPSGLELSDFGIDALGVQIGVTGATAISLSFQQRMDRVRIIGWGNVNSGQSEIAVCLGGSGATIRDSVLADNDIGIFQQSFGAFVENSYSGNSSLDLEVFNVLSDTTYGLSTYIGNTFDECGDLSAYGTTCVYVNNSNNIQFVNDSIWCETSITPPVGASAIHVGGTASNVLLEGDSIGPWAWTSGAQRCNGLVIDSGSTARATMNRYWSGAGQNYVLNNGTYYDVGGNGPGSNGFGGTWGGNNPIASLTHTWNTCYETLAAFGAATLCKQYEDQALWLNRIAASSSVTTTCATAPVVTISDGTNSATLTLTSGASSWTSGALTTTFPTIGNTITVSVTAGSCTTAPANLAVTYNMQSYLNF